MFWLWPYDAHQLDVPDWWLIPVINLLIGLSAALPFYFYLRHDKASQAPTGMSYS